MDNLKADAVDTGDDRMQQIREQEAAQNEWSMRCYGETREEKHDMAYVLDALAETCEHSAGTPYRIVYTNSTGEIVTIWSDFGQHSVSVKSPNANRVLVGIIEDNYSVGDASLFFIDYADEESGLFSGSFDQFYKEKNGLVEGDDGSWGFLSDDEQTQFIERIQPASSDAERIG